ncbi:hypothetical protein BH11MYX4_BH11MYX4_41970 [soil metagenome]
MDELITSEATLAGGIVRRVAVRYTQGKAPIVVVARTNAGTPSGEVRIFPDGFDLALDAAAAAREGRVGDVGFARSLRIETLSAGGLSICLATTDGQPRGSASRLRADEVAALVEAITIARSES